MKIIKPDIVSIVLGTLISLTFLSGNFDLSRLGLFNLQPRLILLATLFFFILYIIFIGKNDSTLSIPNLAIFIISLLFFWLCLAAFSGIYSISVNSAINKYFDLLFVFIAILLTTIALAKKPQCLVIILIIFSVFSMVYSSSSLLVALATGGRGSITIGGPNVATRVIFLGGICAATMYLLTKKNIWVFMIPVSIIGIITIGSRGGIVGCVITIFLAIFLRAIFKFKKSKKSKKSKKRFSPFILVYVIVVCTITYITYPILNAVIQSRIVNLLIVRLHYAGRDNIFLKCWNLILENPLMGLGLGGYSEYLATYPHNLVLELLLDGGFFWIFIFISFLWINLSLFLKFHPYRFLLSLGSFYMIIVQQFSGDYFDFRYFFLFSLIACFSTKIRYGKVNQ